MFYKQLSVNCQVIVYILLSHQTEIYPSGYVAAYYLHHVAKYSGEKVYLVGVTGTQSEIENMGYTCIGTGVCDIMKQFHELLFLPQLARSSTRNTRGLARDVYWLGCKWLKIAFSLFILLSLGWCCSHWIRLSHQLQEADTYNYLPEWSQLLVHSD